MVVVVRMLLGLLGWGFVWLMCGVWCDGSEADAVVVVWTLCLVTVTDYDELVFGSDVVDLCDWDVDVCGGGL